MNHVRMGGEIIRTNNEVRQTPQSQVTDIFMKCPNDDNKGFAFVAADAWGDLAEEVADLPQGTYLEFEGRINTRSYEGNDGKKVNVTSLVIQEILVVEVPEEKPKAKPRSSTGNKSRNSGSTGRSPRQGSKR